MKEKMLKLITKILAVLVICLISFIGIYSQKTNKMENLIKGYNYSKDLSGYREVIFDVSDANIVINAKGNVVGNTDNYNDDKISANSYTKTENKVNADDTLVVENYSKSKDVIEKRLKLLGIKDYNLSINKENGSMYLQIPENEETDHIISNILQVGNFEIRDSEDNTKVFISNDDLKKVTAGYNTTTTGTTIYLQMEFDKNGKSILKEVTEGEYATIENTKNADENTSNDNSENNADEERKEEIKQKKILIAIDSNDMLTTSFDKPIEDGILSLSMGNQSSDKDTISDTLKSTSTIATILNSGKMPLTYKIVKNQYIQTNIVQNNVKYGIIALVIFCGIVLILLISKYKVRGLLAGIAYIGFIAMNLLLIRYTNVVISMESIVAMVVVLIINYIIVHKLLNINEDDKLLKKKIYNTCLINNILLLFPIFIMSIIFIFIKWTTIASFGMVMFWGMVLSIIYNYIITRHLIDN